MENWIYSNDRITHNFDISLGQGNHTFFIMCEDPFGNVAYENTTVEVILDDTYPMATRIYRGGSSLKINTNEKAACYYSTDRCNFNLQEGESMTSAGFKKEH